MSIKKTYFAIEGNIGSGKSTLLNTFQEKNIDYIQTIREPVEEYSSFRGIGNVRHNPLQESYRDSVRSAGFAQLHILQTSGKYYAEKYRQTRRSVIVSERSIWSPTVFISAQKKIDNLSNFAADYLEKELARTLREAGPLVPDHIIFLDASPDLCFKRIKERNRREEQTVSPIYLQTVDECLKEHFCAKEYPGVFAIKIQETTSTEAVFHQIYGFIQDVMKKGKKCRDRFCKCF